MPPSIVRWAFHSPLRLALVGATVAGVLAGALLMATSRLGHDVPAVARPAPRPAPASAMPSPSTATPTPTPSERAGTRSRSRVISASRAFVDTWARRGPVPRSRWLRGVERLTTSALYQGLKVTDPARLPRGHAEQVDLQQLGAFAATTRVRLSRDLGVVLRLVVENGRWLVADVRPVGT